MPISSSRIFHVNSNCSDLDAALAFYRDGLGFTAVTNPLPSRSQPGTAFGLDEVLWDGWVLQGDLGYGGLSLDLLRWTIPAPAGRPPATFHEPGFHRLRFTTPNFSSTLQWINDAGVKVLASAAEAVVIADPDGVPVEVVPGADRRISHVVVNVRDLDASVAYYRDVMGLVPDATCDSQPHVDPLAYGFDGPVITRRARLRDRGSDFTVELVSTMTHEMPPVDRSRQAHHVGLFRMAGTTSDCRGDEAIVRAAGSVPFAPTGTLSVGDHLPLLLVLFWPGPDGECLELIEIPGGS